MRLSSEQQMAFVIDNGGGRALNLPINLSTRRAP